MEFVSWTYQGQAKAMVNISGIGQIIKNIKKTYRAMDIKYGKYF